MKVCALNHGAAGFTLFEMIVVLVISSLMAAVLMQGFGAVLSTRLSVSNAIDDLQETVLVQNILVDPLRGVIPDHSEGANEFRGQPRTLSGQTLRPLLSALGAPTPFKMTLDYDQSRDATILVYEESGRPKVEIGRWSGNSPTFKYRDSVGSWEENWPTETSRSQTPWLIYLDVGPTLIPLVAAVSGPHQRVPRPQDLPFGTGGMSIAK